MTTVQNPAPAYAEHRLAIEIDGVRYAAVLTSPTTTPTRAALLLIPGSLSIDVDGNMPSMHIRPHAYADLAHQLASQGVAVLRYSKGGPGTGTVVFDSVAAQAQKHFRGRVDAARAALDTLLAHVQAPGRVVLAGHSEGAVVAGLLASGDHRVSGLVSLSGPAVGLLSIMRSQLTSHAASQAAPAVFDQAIASLRAGQPLPDEARHDPSTAMLASMDAASLEYIVEVDAVDPQRLYASITRPVLIIQGGRDPSVAEENAHLLAAARRGLPTQVAIFPQLQHFYKIAPIGMDGMAAFALDGESDPAVASAIVAWITTELASAHAVPSP